ncbi:hypothetical protein Tco_0993495 [Tanacetum coccineum]
MTSSNPQMGNATETRVIHNTRNDTAKIIQCYNCKARIALNEDVGIKSFIRLFGITAALIKVSAAQEESFKLLIQDFAASFDSAVHRVHAGSFDAAVASLVSAACVDAAAYFVPAALQSSCFEKIYLETWN